MEEHVSGLLLEEITREIKNLKSLEPGTEQHTKSVESLAKLYRLKLDELKEGWEYSDRFERNEIDKAKAEIERVRTENDKQNQLLKIGLEGFGIGTSLVFNWVWMNRGFKFEEDGIFKSQMFRGLYQKFRLFKR